MSGRLLYTIRKAGAADRDFLYEMLYQSIYVAPGTSPPGRDILRIPRISRYVENWGRKGDYALVAEEQHPGNGSLKLGAIWLRFFPADYPGYGFIDETIPEIGIAVVPGHRGRGIGTALLKSLLSRRESGYTGISLSVDPDNPAADLYRRRGFVECARSGTSIVMRYDFPIIRNAQPEDIPHLARIYLDSRIFAFNWMQPAEFSFSDFQRDTEGEKILVAEVRGKTVGFSSSREPENFIHHLYLNPRDLGRGFGGRLLDETVNHLKRPVRLKAQVRNTKAMWFYRNRGWEELDRGVTELGEYIELVLR